MSETDKSGAESVVQKMKLLGDLAGGMRLPRVKRVVKRAYEVRLFGC